MKPIKKQIGIDLGISSLFTTSDGEKVANPKHFNKLYKKLRLAQKSLSRKVKGSNNREKARVQVARIQAPIADSRRDHTHKLTTQLIRENQTIVVEDLAVKNMVKKRCDPGRVSRPSAKSVGRVSKGLWADAGSAR